MHKILGYFLLFAGLAAMFFALVGMYQTFVNKRPVVQVITLKPIHMNTQYGTVQVDSAVVTPMLNLALFALFMMFLAGLGAKIAGLGCNLLKTERLAAELEKMRMQAALQNEQKIKQL